MNTNTNSDNKLTFTGTLQLLLCMVVTLGIGWFSGVISMDGVRTWYLTIQAPSFRPPNWLFGPVWTLLYALMGVSIFLILKAPAGRKRSEAILFFCLQLFLNFFWSIIFFKLHAIGAALIEILVMWVTILMMILTMRKVKPMAGWLQVPYLLWVSFASILNLAFYLLN